MGTMKPSFASKKVDGNHREIVEALRDFGASVTTTAGVGQGFPDIVVGYKNRNYLMEIKVEGEKLNEKELKWFNGWRGQAVVVRTPEEALSVIGAR